MKKISPWAIALVAIGLLLVLFFTYPSDESPTNDAFDELSMQEGQEVHVPEVSYLFGIAMDSFEVINEKVQSGESFGNILLAKGLGYDKIHSVAENFKEVFDVRRIRAGNTYFLFLDHTDSSSTVRYMVYQSNPIDYYVFDFGDSVSVVKGQKEITEITREVSGEINSSLYQTLVDKGASPELTMRLADIYAWSIDFFRIQKGDYFKVIYKEQFIDDSVSVGVGRILAAEFNHGKESFYSFYYSNGEDYYDYFDENGKTLRKAFLKAPLQFSRISSRYNPKRFHPVLKRFKAHLGTDYAAPSGTPIMATADGEVIAAAYTRGNGNYIKIKHNATYTTQYLHMSKFASGMKKGKIVKQGTVIGYVGSTGLATGPHVCYRFWKNGVQVDPLREKLPEAEPIKPSYQADFNSKMELLKKQIDAMPVGLEEQTDEQMTVTFN